MQALIHATTALVLLLAVAAPFCAEAAPASAWVPCPRGPDVNKCFVMSLAKFFPTIVKGVPSLELPSLDPMDLPPVDFSNKDLKMVTKNTVMTGMFTNVKILEAEADPDKYYEHVAMKIPEITNTGDYELSGKMLMMPVLGSGKYTLRFKDVTVDIKFNGHGEMRDGKNYFKIDKATVTLMPELLEANVENLFNGNKELSDNFHKFVNENWKEIFADVKEKLWDSLSQHFTKIFGDMHMHIPYDEIYT